MTRNQVQLISEDKTQDIDCSQNAVNMYEQRVAKYVLRKFNGSKVAPCQEVQLDFAGKERN